MAGVIDVWARPVDDAFLAAPWLESLLRWTGMSRTAPTLDETVAAMDAGNVDIALLSGWHGPLLPCEPGRPIPYLDDVLLDFPELVVVGGHVGFPWVSEVVSLALKYPNFYVDTSAYVLHRLPADLVAYMAGAGRHRVMFGTNWPMLSPSRALERLDDLGLDDETAALFLGDNARRVFKC